MNFQKTSSDAIALKSYMQANANKMYAAITAASVFASLTPVIAGADVMSGLVENIGGVVIAAIAIIGMIVTAKLTIGYLKGGDGSIGKIVSTILVILVLIGLVVVFMNVDSLKSLFGGVAESATNTAAELSTDILG